MASFVIALNTTRSTAISALSAFLFFSISRICHEMASPSLSGSVAKISFELDFNALTISSKCFLLFGSTSHLGVKSFSTSIEPFFLGRFLTCPYEARTLYSLPKYLFIVLAFAGDSTTTTLVMKIPNSFVLNLTQY